MKGLNMEQMEGLNGGNDRTEFITGMMCGATTLLIFSGIFAPFAAATGVGCAVGLYGEYGDMPRYNG